MAGLSKVTTTLAVPLFSSTVASLTLMLGVPGELSFAAMVTTTCDCDSTALTGVLNVTRKDSWGSDAVSLTTVTRKVLLNSPGAKLSEPELRSKSAKLADELVQE